MATAETQSSSIQAQTAAVAAVKTAATRLAAYDLTEADGFSESLVVPQGKSLTLSAPAAGQKKAGYVTLQPKTIDDVKRWIGVPDNVGKRRNFPVLNASDLASVASQSTAASLTKAQRVSLTNLAYQYVNGDSSVLAQVRDSISRLVADGVINGLYFLKDVDVLPNSELKLAANLKVFFARDIRIWKGGQITILGAMKVDCASIVGNYTAPQTPSVIDDAISLGSLSDFGG